MEDFKEGLGTAWASIAEWLPKLVGFLLIVIIGYFVAKAISKILARVLDRVGFDKAVERGGVKKALEKSQYDASSLLGKIVFYVAFLFVLQLAFSVFGDNPISDMITGIVAYLPKLFVAIVILVVGAALAAAIKEIVEASLGGLDYGKALAFAASTAVITLAFFAALDQLQIAPTVVNGLFYRLVAIVVGSAVVAFGGGGIPVARKYLERWAQKAEEESGKIKQEAEGSQERIKQRAEERKQQYQQSE